MAMLGFYHPWLLGFDFMLLAMLAVIVLDWVAAGQGYTIASRLLELATSRTDRIKRQVETGLIDPLELTGNAVGQPARSSNHAAM
jgi:hypothetical protein